MIEKILSEIQKLILQNEEGANACYPSAMARESAYYECKEIVQEVAKEYAEIARESREDFMEIVYSELEEDEDNNRANRIIDAFDTYAPYQREVAKEYEWVSVDDYLPAHDEIVLVYYECQHIDGYNMIKLYGIGCWDDEFECWKIDAHHKMKADVLAWMPLPPKYEPKDAPYQKGE